MTISHDYPAPFGPHGDEPIDQDLCQRLLGVALRNGGDYADLFFEYRAGGSMTFHEGTLMAAARGVSMGVGVRVQRGEATGYAYTEDLSFDSIRRVAQTASQIAAGGGAKAAILEPNGLLSRKDPGMAWS